MMYDEMFNEHVFVSIGTIGVSRKRHHNSRHKSVFVASFKCDHMEYDVSWSIKFISKMTKNIMCISKNVQQHITHRRWVENESHTWRAGVPANETS